LGIEENVEESLRKFLVEVSRKSDPDQKLSCSKITQSFDKNIFIKTKQLLLLTRKRKNQ
jgi:hypothetical protein